jgi:hypothetical protein
MYIPSEYEKHSGEIADPTGNETEIGLANGVIRDFLADMGSGRVPTTRLESVRDAFDLLHKYAGYPPEHFAMDSFLCASEGISYRKIAKLLPGCVSELNRLIELRYQESRERTDDVPF